MNKSAGIDEEMPAMNKNDCSHMINHVIESSCYLERSESDPRKATPDLSAFTV